MGRSQSELVDVDPGQGHLDENQIQHMYDSKSLHVAHWSQLLYAMRHDDEERVT